MSAADALGAFIPGPRLARPGAPAGPLAGLSFAVKDVMDVAGTSTGNGHPDWLATHPPAARSAVAVERLLDAGASLAGKTIADELCYSLTGENVHYGTPLNPAAPDRVPGGSSSGSASATAGGVVDFALGTDCGGSVRVPSSYCGLFGMRPTHGRIPLTGVAPFAPSFDCVGWFARDAGLLERVGRVLLADAAPAPPVTRLLAPREAFALLSPEAAAALAPALRLAQEAIAPCEEIALATDGLDAWSATFRTLQAAEIWASVGPWIDKVRPAFGPGVKERFDAARAIAPSAVEAAAAHRATIRARLSVLLKPGTALLMPTVPRPAPLRGMATAEVEVVTRHLAMNLLCIAGLGGLPQVSLPLARLEGVPFGISLVGPAGSDTALLRAAVAMTRPG
ncbi:amidase [Xanthobacter oligotrophicus]|uniref:amidase n=1 Tax=Xanthobacter oligotrophicus TaxID=2607286 RepID=UPI0011F11BEA|nr:amidase [Xanthobacter oligotrophicus]MCG5234102.1 amidase [Xanthobacter oligotrophicus]